MKRIISLLTAVVCLMMFTGTVLAEEDSSLTPRQSEAVSLMNDIGIFSEVSEDVAAQSVTRADFVQIMVRILGAEDKLPSAPKRIFTDVPIEHEAAASAQYMYEQGIMVGYDDASFRPDDVITVGEIVKVMVIITGYSNRAEHSGGFLKGYYSQSITTDMLKGVVANASSQISYADAAVIIKNVFESRNYIRITGYKNGNAVESDKNDEDYMSYKLNIYRYSGIVEAYGDTSLSDGGESYRETTVKIGGELLEDGGIDFSEYIGMRVKVYYKADDYHGNSAIHVVLDNNTSYIDISDTEIEEGTTRSKVRYYEGKKLKTANISSEAVFVCNGKRLDVVSDADVLVGNGSVRLISNDGNSVYDVVIIDSYETFIVDKAMSADCAVTLKYDKGTLDFDDDFKTKYYMDGAETDFTSITSGSVLSAAFSKNTSGEVLANVYISNNQVTGKAVAMFSDDRRGVELEDGSRYDFTDEYEERINDGEINTYEPVLNEEGIFYIDCFNRCAGYVLSVASKNYAYVVKCWYDVNEETGSIRLFTKDGEFKDFGYAKNIRLNGSKMNKAQIPEQLKATGENGTVHQLVVYTANEAGDEITKLQTAENKIGEEYYISSENEFVLNEHPKNNSGIACGLRFYKNMAENKPYCFVDGKTVQFMIPPDKTKEKQYKVATKLSSTDVSLAAPLYLYDSGNGGNLGAIVSNTSSSGTYGTPVIIDKILEAVNEDGDVCKMLQFIGGASAAVDPDVIYDTPGGRWDERVDYSNVTVDDLKCGDIIEYTMSDNKINEMRVVVRVDDVGPIRINGDHIQKSGNMIADVISVSDNGRTALVRYVNNQGVEINQTMLVNGTTYRYDSSKEKVYNSSSADLRAGDRILINSFWWSPKLVVIFR